MTTPTEEADRLLQFEAPQSEDARNWEAAEKECLKFPDLFLQKARELGKCRQELQAEQQKAWEERERLNSKLYGFVVRNLIPVVDSCRLALAAAAARRPQEGEEAERRTEEEAALASAQRVVLYVLEELGAVRVELLGQTYDGVFVDGEKVADPFSVLQASQQEKIAQLKVIEVLEDLWITRRQGRLEVLRKGQVNC